MDMRKSGDPRATKCNGRKKELEKIVCEKDQTQPEPRTGASQDTDSKKIACSKQPYKIMQKQCMTLRQNGDPRAVNCRTRKNLVELLCNFATPDDPKPSADIGADDSLISEPKNQLNRNQKQ